MHTLYKKKKDDCPVLRLVQFECNQGIKVGALTEKDGDVVDVCAVDPSIPSNMKEFLEAGPSAMVSAERLVLIHVSVYYVSPIFFNLFINKE